MITIYSDAHSLHQPDYELYDGHQTPYAESAARVDSILAELQHRQLGPIIAPRHFARRHIEVVHSPEYVAFVQNRTRTIHGDETIIPSYFITDTYAPLTKGTYKASLSAVDSALTGAHMISGGETVVYSLCRPPGHHADHHSMGGYCYFNNVAVAAQYLSALSDGNRVAILDVDFHHGNGTQQIFYDRSDVLYVSLHANPARNYPYIHGTQNETGRGDGAGYTINYPLSNNTTNATYLRVLRRAIADIKQFAPQYLIVSAGFDTYHLDPIAGLQLTKNIYRKCGSMISELNLPTLIVQEGGYNTDNLGYLVCEFLEGFSGSST